jgi:transposase-like protein
MPICPSCLSRDLVRHGEYEGQQRWLCRSCDKTTTCPRLRMPRKKLDNQQVKDDYVK